MLEGDAHHSEGNSNVLITVVQDDGPDSLLWNRDGNK